MSTFTTSLVKRLLLANVRNDYILISHTAGMKYYAPPEPPTVDPSEWPEMDLRRPKFVQKQPVYVSEKAPRMKKMIQLMRGPEEVHTDLIYKGYGVKALLGGRLKFEHFETIRHLVTKKMDVDRMFFLWRVEPPWQPVAKRGVGKRMGGGKGSIHHYVTPVKAERIIVEIGGDLHALEAKSILASVAQILPFPARFVSQKSLEEERKRNQWISDNNINPYTMEYVIMNNMGGCSKWLSPYDYKWFGRYR